jgi:dimethylargininase
VSLVALTRPVPDSLIDCELTHLTRVVIDVATARRQHVEYEKALMSAGCEVKRIPAAHDLPDSVFVEDAAIVLDEVAIITRPGASSRRPETRSVAEAVAPFRQLEFLADPGTLDGGDVLRLGRSLYVGVGGRTNMAGARQLADLVSSYRYVVTPVKITECLHLKSAVTELAAGLVLVNPAWVRARTFEGCDAIEVDPGEPFAANVLRIGDTILSASAYDRTNARLTAVGLNVKSVDVAELSKAEAGMTCCCLIFNVDSESQA